MSYFSGKAFLIKYEVRNSSCLKRMPLLLSYDKTLHWVPAKKNADNEFGNVTTLKYPFFDPYFVLCHFSLKTLQGFWI